VNIVEHEGGALKIAKRHIKARLRKLANRKKRHLIWPPPAAFYRAFKLYLLIK